MAFSSQLDFVGLHLLLGLEGGLIKGSSLIEFDGRGGDIEIFSIVDIVSEVLLGNSVFVFLAERSGPKF